MSAANPHETHRLLATLEEFAQEAARGPRSIAHFLERLGPSSLPLVCLLLALPFLPPIATGPLAVAGGITFTLLGWQMMRGEGSARLPNRVIRLTPGPRSWRALSRLLQWTLTVCRRFCRPRLEHWIEGANSQWRVGFLVALGGLLMAIPFVGVPLNNTFPALAIASAVLARLWRDGLLLVVSACFVKVSIAYFALVVWLMFRAGDAAMGWLEGWWPSF